MQNAPDYEVLSVTELSGHFGAFVDMIFQLASMYLDDLHPGTLERVNINSHAAAAAREKKAKKKKKKRNPDVAGPVHFSSCLWCTGHDDMARCILIEAEATTEGCWVWYNFSRVPAIIHFVRRCAHYFPARWYPIILKTPEFSGAIPEEIHGFLRRLSAMETKFTNGELVKQPHISGETYVDQVFKYYTFFRHLYTSEEFRVYIGPSVGKTL